MSNREAYLTYFPPPELLLLSSSLNYVSLVKCSFFACVLKCFFLNFFWKDIWKTGNDCAHFYVLSRVLMHSRFPFLLISKLDHYFLLVFHSWMEKYKWGFPSTCSSIHVYMCVLLCIYVCVHVYAGYISWCRYCFRVFQIYNFIPSSSYKSCHQTHGQAFSQLVS